jgi:hypothetical protein
VARFAFVSGSERGVFDARRIPYLTLALGIGASTTVFSLVNTILLKSSQYPNASRVVVPWRVPPIGSAWKTENLPWGRGVCATDSDQHRILKPGCFQKR